MVMLIVLSLEDGVAGGMWPWEWRGNIMNHALLL